MTLDIALVLAVLAVTVLLFVTEVVRVDVVALLVMVALPWLGLVTATEALAGLSSNAVVSIIGVMILGYGVDRTGVMQRVTQPLLRVAGAREGRLVVLVMGAVGAISAFMQNIGAAALFLPALLRISKRTGIRASRLLMPVGFAAILGGTLTMVASGPLIVVNDLLRQGGQRPFGLFAVAPVGALLLAAGIAYFALFARFVLPVRPEREGDARGAASGEDGGDHQQRIVETWQLPATLHAVSVSADSALVGKTVEDAGLWSTYALNLVALREGADVLYAPWRLSRFAAGQELALLGEEADVARFADAYALGRGEPGARGGKEGWLGELRSDSTAGFAELVVRPRAPLTGRSLRDIAFRKTYGVEPVGLLSADARQFRDFSDQPLAPGDALVVHGVWERVRALGRDPSFLLLTPVDAHDIEPSKSWLAVLCFAASIGLAIAGFPLAISFLTGAVAMIVLRVVPIARAYDAVDFRTVFLLAGLIPLGTAMEKTGAAAFAAQGLVALLGNAPTLVLLGAVGLLTTLFSLFMSNVAATVLLVPLVMVIGERTGIDARGLALLVAVCASNSFVLPTHQVNALFMAPGGYRNADYLRAGGLMSLIFLVIAVGTVWMIWVR
jgi:di/tricarboxylate transporter